MRYVLYNKDQFGNERYLKEDGSLTYNQDQAEVKEAKWWWEIIYLILQVLITWGLDVKIKKLNK